MRKFHLFKEEKILAFIAICVTGIVLFSLFFTLFKPGLPSGHDITAHASYAYLFDSALKQGQFPVRWVEWVQDGHSQPLFSFYQVGFYYFVSLIHLVVPSLTTSLKLAVVLLWWFGSFFVFLLTRRFGLYPGLLASVIFAFSPYILLDIFVRNAFPELGAIAFAPGLLWSIDRYFQSKKNYYLLFVSLFVFLILIFHLPSFLILSILFGGFVMRYLLTKSLKLQQLIMLSLAGLLGLMMSAFYVLPALAEIELIQIKSLTSASFDFHKHFVYPHQFVTYLWGYGGSVEGVFDQMSFQVGIIQWGVITVAILAMLTTLKNKKQREPLSFILLFILIIAITLFLMTEYSAAVWETITPMSYIQFPWRYFMVIALSVAILSALLLSLIRSNFWQVIVLLLVICAQFLLYSEYLKPQGFIESSAMNIDDPNWRYDPKAPSIAHIEKGYTPIGVTRYPTTEIGRYSITKGNATVQPVTVKDDQLILQVVAQDPAQLTINSHYFPGWKVMVDGEEATIESPPDYRFMDIQIPAGEYTVEAEFTNTPVRTLANSISVVSISIFILISLVFLGKQKKKRW